MGLCCIEDTDGDRFSLCLSSAAWPSESDCSAAFVDAEGSGFRAGAWAIGGGIPTIDWRCWGWACDSRAGLGCCRGGVGCLKLSGVPFCCRIWSLGESAVC